MARNARKATPAVEGLEERKLLDGKTIAPNGQPINDQDLRRALVQKVNLQNGSGINDRKKVFPAPGGGLVVLTLFGQGTLEGTFQDPSGALNILYDNTNASSQLTARLRHGAQRVPLRLLTDRDVDPLALSGVGSNQIAAVRLDGLSLIDGGRINLAGGVDFIRLGSMGPNAVIDARSLPLQSGETNPSPTSPQPALQFVDTGNGPELAGVGGFTTPGSAGNTTTSTSGSGSGFTTRVNPDGSVSLIPTSGTGTTSTTDPTTSDAGLSIVIDTVRGTRRPTPLANPQIFGYDPTSQQLIRFDARTGGVLGTIPVPNNGATETGVGLGRVLGRQVVLVGTGNLVSVFDVVTGAPRGSFTTNSIPGFNVVTGIGQTERNVELSDSTANVVQTINVARSLAAGVAVAAGPRNSPLPPFKPTRDFTLSGGATGVAGLSNGYLTGAARFDTFQPDATEFGVLTITTANDVLAETARTQVSTPASLVNNVPPNNTPFALGSIDASLALVTAVNASAGTNTLTLYDPRTLTPQGAVALLWPNRLTGLSESFHPELQGAAVINVGGILKRLQVNQATGMVVNTIGFLNQVRIGSATDSALIGQPFGHASIHQRRNVQIISSTDRGAPKGGVNLIPGLRVVGPLTPPG